MGIYSWRHAIESFIMYGIQMVGSLLLARYANEIACWIYDTANTDRDIHTNGGSSSSSSNNRNCFTVIAIDSEVWLVVRRIHSLVSPTGGEKPKSLDLANYKFTCFSHIGGGGSNNR